MYCNKDLEELSDSSIAALCRRKLELKLNSLNTKTFHTNNVENDPDTTSSDEIDIRKELTIARTRRRLAKAKQHVMTTSDETDSENSDIAAGNKLLPILKTPISFIVYKNSTNNNIDTKTNNVMQDVSNTININPAKQQDDGKMEKDSNTAISNEKQRKLEQIMNSNSMTARLLKIKYGNIEYLNTTTFQAGNNSQYGWSEGNHHN